ncbi:nuclear pore complex protein Nup133-like isoform X2 [Varroa destructor]|uniref:Nuclear pore complex protein Nup133 n=1 Tax=Varroa destructor TaxID=109461 RepID=A0A7M7KBP1_VARDE|nr:nuclear pore complex protein Nup133-like isoform X2 [Varroa destructor]
MFGSPRTPSGRKRRYTLLKSPGAGLNTSQLTPGAHLLQEQESRKGDGLRDSKRTRYSAVQPRTPQRAKASIVVGGNSLNASALQTSLLGETPLHILETSGSSLPVHVVESLLSLQTTPSTGWPVVLTQLWGWLVVRSRLLVFQHSQQRSSKTCFSLELPNSFLLHQANLCYVGETSPAPNCIVVSPMGVVRYWPNISHEAVFTETSVDMGGEECFQLVHLGEYNFVVATTTGSLIKVAVLGGRQANATLDTRKVKIHQGVLSELGKRMSSLLFGAMPIAGDTNHRLARRLLVRPTVDEVLILFENAIQCWGRWEDGAEAPRFDFDLNSLVKEAFRTKIWNNEPLSEEDIQCWCIDAQICKEEVLLLMAGVGAHMPSTLHYALALVDADCPQDLRTFTPLVETAVLTDANLDHLLAARCLLPHAREVFVYTRTKVMCIDLGEGDQDTIRLPANDAILGCGARDGQPLILTLNNHLALLKTTGRQALKTLPPDDTDRIAEWFLDPAELNCDPDSAEGLLRRALVHHSRGELTQSQTLLEKVFPTLVEGNAAEGMDEVLFDLSRALLDDPPAGDPRWGRRGGKGKSALIENQIADKEHAFDILIQFLKVNKVWKKLSGTVTVDGMELPTRLALHEHREMLAMAEGLNAAYERVRSAQRILDVAAKRVTAMRNEQAPSKSLSSRDLCFVRVARIDELLPEVQSYLEEFIEEEDASLIEHLINANALFVGALRGIKPLREKLLAQEPSLIEAGEYLPWTSRRLRSFVIRQCELSEEHALEHSFTSADTKRQIISQMVELSRCVLEDYVLHIKSLEVSAPRGSVELARQKMSADRQKLIGLLYKSKQLDTATSLAEEFLEFPLLVRICEESNQQSKLLNYMEMFSKENFAEFVFQYYVDTGKKDKLLSQPSTYNTELSRFLQAHGSLHWMHCIKSGDFRRACQSLKHLAEKERALLKRKKIQVSLAKLSALACANPQDGEKELDEINAMADLVALQESLSVQILAKNGYTKANCPVLEPAEMIKIITEANSQREQDYKIALDLVAFLPAEERPKFRRDIWARAILQDTWECLEGAYITDIMRDLLFFQIVELAFLQNYDLNEFMPPIDDLIQSELLNDIRDNDSFQYILCAGYEHVMRMTAT